MRVICTLFSGILFVLCLCSMVTVSFAYDDEETICLKQVESSCELDLLKKKKHPDRYKVIFIQNSNFSSISEDVFSKFTNIEVIIICDNRNLKSLPQKLIFGLKKLKQLDVKSCGLTEIPDKLLINNPSLKSVSFEDNKLTYLSENLFQHNDQLTSIRLEYNEFSSFPDNIFSHLSNLSMLLVYYNKIEIGKGQFLRKYGLNQDLNLIL